MVTITAPSSSVVQRATSITVSWTTSYPQSAYEVDYKLASSSTWNVLVAKTTSTAKSTTISLGSIQDFSEYHIKVVSYADNTSDGGSPITNYYTGTDQSAGFCLYVVPSGSVSKFKAKVGTGLIEIPLYDSVTTTPKLKARVSSTTTKTAGLVDVGSVGASQLKVNTGSGIKAAALASPKYYHAGPGKSTYELVKSTYNYYGQKYNTYTYGYYGSYNHLYTYSYYKTYQTLYTYGYYSSYIVPHSYTTYYTYYTSSTVTKYDVSAATMSNYEFWRRLEEAYTSYSYYNKLCRESTTGYKLYYWRSYSYYSKSYNVVVNYSQDNWLGSPLKWNSYSKEVKIDNVTWRYLHYSDRAYAPPFRPGYTIVYIDIGTGGVRDERYFCVGPADISYTSTVYTPHTYSHIYSWNTTYTYYLTGSYINYYTYYLTGSYTTKYNYYLSGSYTTLYNYAYTGYKYSFLYV